MMPVSDIHDALAAGDRLKQAGVSRT